MITLDDMTSLLHIPIIGQFSTYIALEYEEACWILIEQLKIKESDVNIEM